MTKTTSILIDKLKTIFLRGRIAVIFKMVSRLRNWRRTSWEEKGLDYLFPNRHNVDFDFDPDNINPESFEKE